MGLRPRTGVEPRCTLADVLGAAPLPGLSEFNGLLVYVTSAVEGPRHMRGTEVQCPLRSCRYRQWSGQEGP